MNSLFKNFMISLMVIAVVGCEKPEEKPAEPVLTKTSFEKLKGWAADDLTAALGTFQKSCARIIHRPAEQAFGDADWFGAYGDWIPLCHKALRMVNADATESRDFFESNFIPYKVDSSVSKKEKGVFTGYYEPSLNGSRTQHDAYQTPILARPDDLVMVNLGDFRPHLKGERIAGRVQNGQLRPYEARFEIENGDLPEDQTRVIAWVDDPISAFFLQIQGSGRILMDETGEELRVGYGGQNGHPYFAIGKALIENGVLTKEEVSLQTIRAWLKDNPDQASAIMNLNPSYVFFQELGSEGPFGGEGVVLTEERSLAIDSSLYPYGVPIWLDADHPKGDDTPRLQRLMVAQDTGGAIRGVVRGDFFWGHGQEAEDMAGVMKSEGSMWMLLPKNITVETAE